MAAVEADHRANAPFPASAMASTSDTLLLAPGSLVKATGSRRGALAIRWLCSSTGPAIRRSPRRRPRPAANLHGAGRGRIGGKDRARSDGRRLPGHCSRYGLCHRLALPRAALGRGAPREPTASPRPGTKQHRECDRPAGTGADRQMHERPAEGRCCNGHVGIGRRV